MTLDTKGALRVLCMVVVAAPGAACGGDAVVNEAPDEVLSGAGSEVEPETDAVALAGVEATMAAQVAAMEARDVESYVALYTDDADTFLLGPVDDAVAEDGTAVRAMVREVFAEPPPEVQFEVEARREGFGYADGAAWTFHVVTVSARITADAEPRATPYYATQIYQRTTEGWRVAHATWTVAVPNAQYRQMAIDEALPEAGAIAGRNDAGCERIAATVNAFRDERVMPPFELLEGSLGVGTAPGEIQPFTEEQYAGIVRAREAGVAAMESGPGGVRAQRIGGFCVTVTNLVSDVHPPQGPAFRMPLRQTAVWDAASGGVVHAQWSTVLPRQE